MTLSTTLFIDLITIQLADATHVPRPPPYAPPTEGAGSPHPCIASAVDYNQLLFFLVANVLTGLVNFSMDTLHAGMGVALTVLMVYMATLTALFLTLHRLRVKVKL
jgi:phosphatidylinositol glycan class W